MSRIGDGQVLTSARKLAGSIPDSVENSRLRVVRVTVQSSVNVQVSSPGTKHLGMRAFLEL